jgi:hypothetical protein
MAYLAHMRRRNTMHFSRQVRRAEPMAHVVLTAYEHDGVSGPDHGEGARLPDLDCPHPSRAGAGEAIYASGGCPRPIALLTEQKLQDATTASQRADYGSG